MDGNLQIESMEQHLLFHKAMAEDVESFNKINGYMSILNNAEVGEKLSDPIDESIRAVFNLVLQNGIDPWEIDLREFVKLYTRKVAENSFDMIVAGKLMLMAWKILRMQSDATRSRVDEPLDNEFFDFDFQLEDEDENMYVPEVAFKAAFQREEMRPVTMYELIDAFEDARYDMEIAQERERVRSELKAKEPRKFDNKAHDEDDEKDVGRVWERIEKLGAGPFQIDELYTPSIKQNLTIFVSVLHLVRDGKLSVWQDVLPRGEIFIEILMHEVSGSLEDSKGIVAVN